MLVPSDPAILLAPLVRRPGSEKDITEVSGTSSPGSTPGRGNLKNPPKLFVISSSGTSRRRPLGAQCSHSVVRNSAREWLDDLRFASAVVLLALFSPWRLEYRKPR
jgi:hypothetical protein